MLCHAMVDTETFHERVEAVAAAGVSEIALDLPHFRKYVEGGESPADMAAASRLNGVRVAEVWSLYGVADPGEVSTNPQLLPDLLSVAEVFGSHIIGAPTGFGGDVGRSAEVLGIACDRAADQGVSIGVEFVAFRDLNDVVTASEIVSAAGRANVHVVIDCWHFFRGGRPDFDSLTLVPGELIGALQFNDGFWQPQVTNPRDEVRSHRPLPGGGEFDVAQLVRIVAEKSPSVRWCVESHSDELNALPPQVVAQVAADHCWRFLDGVLGPVN
jgi:sugar phosphate isomerase/epimerase